MRYALDKIKVCNFLEVARWTGAGTGLFIAYSIGKDPVQQFGILSVWLVISIAGLTGLESVFLGKAASELSGYGDSGPYQRQSGFNNIALALAMLLAYCLGWGFYAQLGLTTALLIFLTLSASNHAYSAIKEKNRSIKNLLRPAMTLLLLTAILPLMINAINLAKGIK